MLNAQQHTVGPFGCQGTFLAYTELIINHAPRPPAPQISFCMAALQPLVPVYTYIQASRITLSPVQDLSFILVKFNMIGDYPAL